MSEDNSVLQINALTGAVVATYPTDLANDGAIFGPDGSLYVADYNNNQIDHYSASGTLLSTFGAGELTSPQGLTFGPDGNLYVTNANGAVDTFTPTGSFVGTFIAAGSGGLTNAKAIVWGPDGNAYVSSYYNSEVIRFNGTTGAFMNVFATGGGGFEGITFGPDGNLYAASYGNNTVYYFNGTTGALLGTIGSGAQLDNPFSVGFDPAGNLDVVSRTSGTIQTFSSANGTFLSTLASGLTNPAYLVAGNSSVYGQSVTYTATVSAVSPATGTPTGTVTFMDGTTDLATVSLTGGTAVYTTTALSVGSHDITVDYNGDSNFAASTSTTLIQGITPASLTITANNASKTYGQTLAFAGTEFTTSGLVNTDSVASVTLTSAGAAATATVAGSPYSIIASAATGSGLGNYSIHYVNGSLTVTPAPLTITANDASKTYGQTLAFAGTAFTTSGLVNTDSVASVTLTSSGAAATATVAGSPYTIIASAATGSGLGNYSINYVNGSLSVTPATLTITANNATKTYGQTLGFAGTDFTTSGLLNTDTVTSVTLTSAGAAATATVAGSPYAIIAGAATGSGLSNYSINYVNGSLSVTPATLTITAGNTSKTYGQSLGIIDTVTTSGLVNSDVVTNVTLTSAGVAATAPVAGSPYVIIASDATGFGLGNYNIDYVNGSLTITPALLIITADNVTKTYGQTLDFAGTEFTTSGLLNSDTVTSVTLTSPGAAATATVAGSPYVIIASTAGGSGLGNYTIDYVNGSLTVTPATLIVTANNTTKVVGQANPAFSDTVSGFVNGDNASVVSGIASLSTMATAGSGVGSYTITAAQGNLSAANYTFAFANGTLTITPVAAPIPPPSSVPTLPPSPVPTPRASPMPTPIASPMSTQQASIPPISLVFGTTSASSSGGEASGGSPSSSAPPPSLFRSALLVVAPAPSGRGNDATSDSSLIIQSAVNSATRTNQVFSAIPHITWVEGQVVSALQATETALDAIGERLSAVSMASMQTQSAQADDGFDVLNDEGKRVPWTEPGLEATMVIGTGVIAASGYVFLNSRLGLWMLGLLTSQPLWKQFDPLDVLYAWEDEEEGVKDDQEEETLLSLVD